MARNPKRYRELTVPYPTRAAADDALSEFFAAVEAARVEHRIPDVHVMALIRWEEPDGEEGEGMGRLHLGDSLKALPMLAEAYGREQADFDRLIAQAKRGPKP